MYRASGSHRLLADCPSPHPPPVSRCECAPGYAGDNCSEVQDDCRDHRCQNGAQCVDEVNSYSCVCAEGYR